MGSRIGARTGHPNDEPRIVTLTGRYGGAGNSR
jgi:hypothetical protein